MAKKSKSYLTIVASAQKLFWKHGIKKVSVEEISLAAGVSKMTFYRSFSNKDEVAEIILTDLMEKGTNDYHKLMASEIPFESKLQEIIKLKKAASKEISQELLKDIFINPDSKLAGLMLAQSEKSNKMFEADLRKAQKNGELREGLKIEFIIYMLGNIYHLMEDEKLIDLFDGSEDLAGEITNFFFYGMLRPNDT
jgi:AcrR family transcriptional regulator